MSKQTAVEWLIEKLDQNFDYVADTLIEQAKAMEREQIEEAYGHGSNNGYMYAMEKNIIISRERYYDETYKGGTNE